jgi:tetratricopeptide (TPR) repeat protein
VLALVSEEDLVKEGRCEIEDGNRDSGTAKLLKAANLLDRKQEYEKASHIFTEVAELLAGLYRAEEALQAYDNATLMLVRVPQTPEAYRRISELNQAAAKIAEQAGEFKRASEYYFRAKDFVEDEDTSRMLSMKAADALESLADIKEEEGDYAETVSLLRKVGRLYYMADDEELGERINDRAVRVAHRWAESARKAGDYLSAGNALAEAAQIMQTKGDSPEATRTMMEAGELYEAANLFEKAGNIYDAAQEAYKLQRLTSARNQAISKAAEAYLKLEGKPEVVAPLLVKGGHLFSEIGRVMKAKWAFKRGGELFAELAERAASDNEVESEKQYLRYQAMCLRRWGQEDKASDIYRQVTEFYLKQAEEEEKAGNLEQQAIALEEAAEVFTEADQIEEAKKQVERAISLYTDLAEGATETEDNESASKHYSRAADCAKRIGDEDLYRQYHLKASERAVAAAAFYDSIEVTELATIWRRTAGQEALKSGGLDVVETAINLLAQSAEGFRKVNEDKEAFEDLFVVFEARFLFLPDKRKPINNIIKTMEEISMAQQDEVISALTSIVRALNAGNHIGALLTLQENEDHLLSKADRIRALISQSKLVRPTK